MPNIDVPAAPVPPKLPVTTPDMVERPTGLRAATVSRRKAPGSFAHAPDYSWLQGIVEKTTPAGFVLRYAESTADDAYGGRALLQGSTRMELGDGDPVLVEGRFTQSQPTSRERQSSAAVAYQVDRMQRVR
jgi:hypothetical protein